MIKIIPSNNLFLQNGKCELTMTLFTDCNLRCGFCYYKDYQKVGPYPEMASTILSNFKHAVAGIKSPKIEVSILGGELFQDKFDDTVFKQYDEIIKGCIAILKNHNKQFEIKLMSNLILKKVDRLINILVGKENTYLQVSYDPTNRFPKKYHLNLWFKNFEAIRKAGISVAVLMVDTKPNILSILNDDGENHEHTIRLLSDKTLRIDITPYHMDSIDPSKTEFKSDPQLLLAFGKYMIDNFPHVLPYAKYIQLATHKTSAINMADKCSSENVNLFYKGFVQQNFSNISCCDRKKTISNFYKSHGCLQCQHFEYCFHECYYYDQYNACDLKELFDYIIMRRLS